MSLLEDFPYEFDQVFSFDNAGVLEFWLNDVTPIKHLHAPEGTYASEYVVMVDLPEHDAANLVYLMEQGATVSILPNTSAAYSQDPQRVPVSLIITASEPLPDMDQVAIIASLTSASSSFEEIKALVSPDRVKDGRIELLHLTDVTFVNTHPAEADGLTLVTVAVAPYSARQLEYLVEIDAEFTFVPTSEP